MGKYDLETIRLFSALFVTIHTFARRKQECKDEDILHYDYRSIKENQNDKQLEVVIIRYQAGYKEL